MATSGRRSGAALALAAVLAAPDALATGPSPTDVATARELYTQGANALDAGNATLAATKLANAWTLVHTPVIGYDLARAQVVLGRLVEAREAALAVQRLPVASDETARSARARDDAAQLAAQLGPRIPHVTLDVEGLAGHGATVKLDGRVVPSAVLSVARDANPGPHAASVDTDDGRHADGSVVLVEGEAKSLVLRLEPLASPPPSSPTHGAARAERPAAPPPLAAKPERASHLSPLVWIGVATGGLGLALGAVTGAFAFSEAETVKNHCTTPASDGALLCMPPYDGDLSAANALGVASTVSFVVAGVGVAVLVTGLVIGASHGHAASAWIAPFVGPVSGVRGAF